MSRTFGKASNVAHLLNESGDGFRAYEGKVNEIIAAVCSQLKTSYEVLQDGDNCRIRGFNNDQLLKSQTFYKDNDSDYSIFFP